MKETSNSTYEKVDPHDVIRRLRRLLNYFEEKIKFHEKELSNPYLS